MKATLLLVSVTAVFSACDAYKILVIFPLEGKSHGILGDGIVRHLLTAGHEVTYMTPFPKNKGNPMLHEIDISGIMSFEEFSDILKLKNLMNQKIDFNKLLLNSLWFSGNYITNTIVGNEKFQNFLADKTQHFDAVIVEWLMTDVYNTIGAIYDAPLITFSSVEPHWMIMSLIDETLNPAYNGYLTAETPPFSFVQRVKELTFTVVQTTLRNTIALYLNNKSYNNYIVPHIVARGKTPPSFTELLYNASLVIGNSHVSMGDAKSLPPNYINIGGYHIDDNPKPLPDDLKKIIESAKHGVIYFSMGSNLRSEGFPDEVKIGLLRTFGSLKQTVLWKFEEQLPNLPSNVHILEWAPQQSILAHPNVILFITHGGLLSTTEAIYAGKPVIGIPVFGDQYANVGLAANRGFALRVDLSYTMADDLKVAIEEMLSNPNYSKKVKELSFIHHDRPVKPGKEMVHWVEHVIKTKGAPHLRTAALLVPWYQKMFLDLATLIVVIVIALRYIYRRVRKNTFADKVRNTNKKNN